MTVPGTAHQVGLDVREDALELQLADRGVLQRLPHDAADASAIARPSATL